MGPLVGVVLAIIYTAICSVLSVLIFLKRDHHYMKPRDPGILLMQNAGSIIAVNLIGFYPYLRPNYLCGLYLTGILLTYTTFVIPLLCRCWEYCINFRLSYLKRHCKTLYFLQWDISSNVLLHQLDQQHDWIKYLASRQFLIKVLVLEALVFTVPLCWMVFQPFASTQSEDGVCLMPDSFYQAGIAITCVLGAAGVIIAMLLLRVKTVIKGKIEMVLSGFIWIAHTSAFFYCCWHLPPNFTYDYSLLLVQAYYLSLFVGNFMPLVYIRKFDSESSFEHATFAKFVELLQLLEFREQFHEFLEKKLSQENLQLYEVVQYWKQMPDDHPEKPAKAKSILAVFFTEGSACEVNVSYEIRQRITFAINGSYGSSNRNFDPKKPIANDVFDEGLGVLVRDMFDNNFAEFWVVWAKRVPQA